MLSNWHQGPDSQCCKSLRRGGPALDDQLPWVSNQMFKLNRRDVPKIKHSLQFLDALWTKEERDKMINKRLLNLDAICLHETLNKRVSELHICWRNQCLTNWSHSPMQKATCKFWAIQSRSSNCRVHLRIMFPTGKRKGKSRHRQICWQLLSTEPTKYECVRRTHANVNQSSTRPTARTTTGTVPPTARTAAPQLRPLHPGGTESVEGDSRTL